MHKKLRILIALVVVLFASLACQTVMGGGVPQPPAPTSPPVQAEVTVAVATEISQPTEPAAAPTVAPSSGVTEAVFPMPTDASNVTDMGTDLLNFQTKLSLKATIAFYRDAFGKAGYKEREILTAITDTVFSLVFDGHASGKAIVVQGVDMGNGTVNVNITLQDL